MWRRLIYRDVEEASIYTLKILKILKIYIYIYVYTHTHTHTHTYTHTHTHTYI